MFLQARARAGFFVDEPVVFREAARRFMTTADLGGRLLASVSRSFYLSIRILPAALREPIGLAYLLARASDTIADSAAAPAEVRLAHLAAFGQMAGSLSPAGLAELQREIQPTDPGERELIAKLGRALEWLAALDAPARAEIQRVLGVIIHGQTLDLQRFPAAGGAEPVALQTAAELEEYTYLVAGCVGEFWTRLCLQRLPTYSRMSLEELSRIGTNFGKGLQLVNILRDLPADLRSGRCYLPEEELRAAGTSPARLLSEPQTARPVFDRWRQRASELLEDGRAYIIAIRPARVRAACYLPLFLGEKTLRLLQRTPPLENAERVKVPRSNVYQGLARAMVTAFSNVLLSR
jgi:farnesyl-diphosphate farnesyltransferase